MEIIQTEKAPLPLGHYSQALLHKDIVYLSMQIPINPLDLDNIPESVSDQAQQLLKNIEEILMASGSDRDHVLRATIYITDMDMWDKVNCVYEQFFNHHKPARGVVHIISLYKNCHVAMDVIAAVK